ncbi:hypothetical protein U27_07017 [Candidatus Vecturithrix granuli]|uniref:SH3b domain-containing protein n=1 Tax=Vecturithrix granuli TaxID=1499967 RepID=A0A081C625_VECG1|nr:hypothetical protein U27_07017 [Candidatus Vecturithrix granuli]
MKKIFLWGLAMILFFLEIMPIQAQNSSFRILTASNVRIRQKPNASAPEVTKLALGTLVQELGRTPKQETIGAVQDYWYQIAIPDGQQGWIFGGFTMVYQETQREAIYQEITQARLKREQLNWFDQIDLVRFLTHASGEVSTPAIAAELKLARLRVLRQSLEPLQNPPPEFQAWIQEQQANIYYAEIQGTWLVLPNVFWDLYAEYQTLPIADDIAWEAAQNPVGGECEGYVPCHLSRINQSYGRYLTLYPTGKYTSTALHTISEELQNFTQHKYTDYDRTGYLTLQNEIKRLRSIVEATSIPEKVGVLEQLEQIARLHLHRE